MKMAFDNLIGQKKNIDLFHKIYEKQRFAHAYLFYGDEGTGKLTFALEIAKILLCGNKEFDYCNTCPDCLKLNKMEHPNQQFLFPVYKDIDPDILYESQMELKNNPYKKILFSKAISISIGSIRNIKKKLSLTSFFHKKMVIIIKDADQMNMEAYNSILKILEEPPPETIFLLTTNHIQKIIPTVKSRCHMVNFPIISREEITEALIKRENLSSELSEMIAECSFGSYGKTLELIEENVEDKKVFIKEVIKKIFSTQKSDILFLSEELSKKRDRGFLKELLIDLAIELREIMKSFNTENDESSQGLLKHYKFLNNLDDITIQIPEMIIEIENSIDLIDKNIYLNILLTVLFYRLNSMLNF